jgi:uncharacterized protein (UPF0262 family)
LAERHQRNPAGRLIGVDIDDVSVARSTSDVEHERAVAIYDLLEDNCFCPTGHDGGEFRLRLSIVDRKLVFEVSDGGGETVTTHILSLTPLRRLVRDYFLICDSYYAAIRTASPSKIEAIDMGRRGLHDEGSTILKDRLGGKIEVDFETARRLFTLICALHWKG